MTVPPGHGMQEQRLEQELAQARETRWTIVAALGMVALMWWLSQQEP